MKHRLSLIVGALIFALGAWSAVLLVKPVESMPGPKFYDAAHSRVWWYQGPRCNGQQLNADDRAYIATTQGRADIVKHGVMLCGEDAARWIDTVLEPSK